MPIEDKWRKLIPEQIHNVPDFQGVFEFTDILQEAILYIGRTESLVHTIEEIFERRPPEFATVAFFRFHATADYENEYKLLIEEYKQKHNKLPIVNQKKEEQQA
jgi:hypothetical protein